MDGAKLLTAAEFQSLLYLTSQRGRTADEDTRIYDQIDVLLAFAWQRSVGVERYMLLRLTNRGVTYEIQATRFEGSGCSEQPFVSIAGPKLTPSGGLGRKVHSYELLGRTHVERRMLDGTWRTLGVVLPEVIR